MPRTESPEEFVSTVPRSDGAQSAAAVGKWAAKLAAYGVATVAFTFMLLRPGRSASGKRGSLFLGSGMVVVLMRALLGGSNDPSVGPATPPAPVLAAATPVPAPASPATATAARPQPRVTAPPRSSAPSAAASKPQSGAVAAESVSKKQVAAVAGEAKPQAAVPSVAAPAPVAKAGAAARPERRPAVLGPRYADKASGYSIQLPAGWASKPLKDGCWVLDASDGQTAAITIGFSKFPATMSVDEVVPEKVSRGIQKRTGTVVHSTGYSSIAGRRCLWHKYTGPVSRPGGNTRMTTVHYLLPLQDGRALEVKVAATPEKFGQMAPRMKKSLDSFKLLTPVASVGRAR